MSLVIKQWDVDSVPCLALEGELEGVTMDAFRKEMQEILARKHSFILDLSRVEDGYSVDLDILLKVKKIADSQALSVAFVAASELYTFLEEVSNLKGVLTIVNNLEDAVQILQRRLS